MKKANKKIQDSDSIVISKDSDDNVNKMTRSLSFSDMLTFIIKHDDGDDDDVDDNGIGILKTPPKGISYASPHVQRTTLLQPVRCSGGIEMEYVLKQFKIQPSLYPCWENDTGPLENIVYNFSSKSDTKVGPAFQVTSISIFNKNPSWGGCSVYGHISVTDSNASSFTIYKRESYYVDRVSSYQNELSLERCPIAPLLKGKVSFCLFSGRGAKIIAYDSYVEYSINDGGGVNEEELFVPGEDGYYVKMVYSIIPYALIAKVVSMSVYGPPGLLYGTMRVGGSITANGIDFLKEKILKFENSFPKKSVYCVPRSRDAIAVPVLSSLLFEISLTRSGTEFASGILESCPLWHTKQTLYFDFEDKKHSLCIDVHWVSPDTFFGFHREIYKPTESNFYVEVYSVLIGGGSSAPALCGEILVQDGDESVHVFSRNKECPDDLMPFRRIVSLVWPADRWVLEKNFQMHLKLKDVEGRPVCKGDLSWYDDSDLCPTRFDRRMCSVIPGQDGYFAAVHYSIFRFGLQAKFNLIVECEGLGDHFDVYGNVYAQYNNYDYSSAYDKEYYRLVIFDRPEEYRVNVNNCSEIPLSKSLITAPSDCGSLSLFVSLTVRPIMDACMVPCDLFTIQNLQFMAGTDASRQLPLFRHGGDVRRWGCATLKVDWFGCNEGSILPSIPIAKRTRSQSPPHLEILEDDEAPLINQLQDHRKSLLDVVPVLKVRPSIMTRSLSLSDLSTLEHDDDQIGILRKAPTGISQASPYVQGSTLLEPVRYCGGLDKDEKEYVKKQHEIRQWEKEYEYMNSVIDIYNLTGFKEGESYIEVGPALQVSSISIFNTDLSWDGSLIHGDISVIESNDRVFNIYKRKPGNSDRISRDQSELSLTEFPVAPVLRGKITFSLSTLSGVRIFACDSYVDYSIKDGGVNEVELIVPGGDGYYAVMVFTIIPYAIIAEIDQLSLVGPPGAENICVEGNIKANSINILKNKKFIPGEKLARKQPTYHGQMVRTAIVIPVLSSFQADISFTIGGTEFAVGPLKSKDLGKFLEDTLFFEFKDIKYSFYMDINLVGLDKYFGLHPKMYNLPVNSDHYVEVFSVFVGGDSPTNSLCGTIVVQDLDETVYIFSRNKECPDNLVRFRRIVSLTWPSRWVLEKNFYMHLKLKDVKGQQICRGGLYFYHEGGCPITRLDRRMCAIIPGQDGHFAAVHYSIFRFGLQARVTVNVDCEGICDNFDVFGSVYAEYNNYDYSSAYDREYYRLIIFDRPEEYRANVKNCSKIPLSKSFVTAPSDCGWLSFFVSLKVRPFVGSCKASSDLFTIGNLQFTASTDASRQLLLYQHGGSVRCWGYVTLKVDWFGCRQ